MSKRTQKVLIIELEDELAALDQLILTEAGYEAILTVCGALPWRR